LLRQGNPQIVVSLHEIRFYLNCLDEVVSGLIDFPYRRKGSTDVKMYLRIFQIARWSDPLPVDSQTLRN